MAMNVFRMSGDTCHIVGILLLLYIVRINGNASGVSRKAQELFLVVFVSRYLDLFTTFYSMYNSCLKVFFILSTAAIIYTIRCVEPAKSTYSAAQDDFSLWKYTFIPCSVISFILHLFGKGSIDLTGDELEVHFEYMDPLELFWTFSICLEPMAMVPQLLMFRRNRNLSTHLRVSIAFFGIYRFAYILNWIHRAHTEPYYRHHYLVYICGVLQTMMYSDFVYYHSRMACHMCSTMTSANEQVTTVDSSGQDMNSPLLPESETASSELPLLTSTSGASSELPSLTSTSGASQSGSNAAEQSSEVPEGERLLIV